MKQLLIGALLIITFSANAQVGIGTATPDASAQLDLTSISKGLLVPRMTQAQRDAIVSPAIGLMIFCTDCVPNGEPEYNNGIRWTSMNAAPLANVSIGGQVWTSSNLSVSRYRNGDPIPEVTTGWLPFSITTGAWCWYNNDSVTYASTYGRLYNWAAVNDPRGLAPAGWHIPTDEEWTTLTTQLASESVAGGKMKETGTSHWAAPNTGATNLSGFNGLPGGRNDEGPFNELSFTGYWWSSSAAGGTTSFTRNLFYGSTGLLRGGWQNTNGFSVRCVRD